MKRIFVIFALGLLLAGCTQYGGSYAPPSGGNAGPSMGSGGSNPSGSGSMNETTPAMNGTPSGNGSSMNQSPAMNGTMTAPWSGGSFNTPGNVLITDQFNNRVIEVNPATDNIVWSFGSGNGSECNPGPGAIIGTNWAERLPGGRTLMAGTGIPSSDTSKGCPDNRVIIVDQFGKIVWQYGKAGVTGSGDDELDTPVAAIQVPNGDILITDQGNNRVIEVDQRKNVVWSYGPDNGSGALASPNSAELLDNGHILIADENNNRTIEIDRNGSILWQYDAGLGAVGFASRLPNGNTLISDTGNNRIVEVTPDKLVARQFYTNASAGSNPAPEPTNAVELANGYTMIADQFNHRVLAIDGNYTTVWQYGRTNEAGNGPGELNAPYTAFVIGDYNGQTVPPVMGLSSPSFANGTMIPAQFTCEGNNTSPELIVTDVPAGTKSMALTVFDTDASFVHWTAWNLDPGTYDIPANSSSGMQGMNGLGPGYKGPWPKNGYIGPCPPPGNAHHYYFRVYALDSELGLPPSANMTGLMQAMIGHAIMEAELMGTYKCSKETAAADGLCR